MSTLPTKFLVYKTDDSNVTIDVIVDQETIWASQKSIAQLFGKSVSTINEHLKQIYSTEELSPESTIRKFRIVQNEGGHDVTRNINYYNLDAIISVGYRVNSIQATRFRQWATQTLNIAQKLYITKDRKKADFSVKIDRDSENHVAIVKELKDPSDTHKYSYNNIITAVNERLKKRNIQLGYKSGFNSYVLSLFIEFYNIKSDSKYAYKHCIGKQTSYTYSQQLVEFIVSQIKKDPNNFVESLKRAKK
ncbi:RhuM family protein [Ligilactobacillus murinus]|uniref:Virulence RhuM family protein n=1 Tax=Ligilactobacillus murinus TaxID=1622 RepID=A0AAE6WIJ2_9LACO|nr:RhuM family protein [Ligilactobacillus murinus]NEF81880.1 virulence RhuM family protein [Ligilactobacillus murinus]NEF84007.1 virulence RhuM family protein [Ligilactobacillus murinus]NEF86408.1 virulence RhuM family protein [Ligilactobacillus murinus]NEF88718.1 virulence RhuM family protein [Ligilactobacillus murinus]NEF90986.1 virulence RhuM family protein [Ligilactobacillus murinus]